MAGSPSPVVLVTGMSGAGRSFTLKTLEDIGYETVDNLPLSLLKMIIDPASALSHPVAIGIDVRTRDFSVPMFLEQIQRFQEREDLKLEIVFCECDDEVLAQRYTETRRRHPLAGERPVMDGIQAERRMLEEIREHATYILDTTNLSVVDTRHILQRQFALEGESQLFIQVLSFAFRHGIPREADLVYDVRFLKNPHYDPDLQPLTGQDKPVAAYIGRDPLTDPFIQQVKATLVMMLPRFDEDARSYLTIAFGCTGGQHRSVFMAETIFQWLRTMRRHISLRHRDVRPLGNHTIPGKRSEQ